MTKSVKSYFPNVQPLLGCLVLLAAASPAVAEIPEKVQKRILSFAPQADTNEDGVLSIEEMRGFYPSLPAPVQQRLSSRYPEIAEGLAPEAGVAPAFTFKRPAGSPEVGRKQGFNCLFLGHSYFAPIVMQMEKHAAGLGLENHQQFTVFNGGPKGSPGMLWDNPISAPAKELIRTGNVEVLAMTSHYQGSEPEDYGRWVDLALEHNPATIFVIQAPWAQKQEKEFVEYKAEIESILLATDQLLEALRAKYPGKVFLRVAQAQWMLDLWRLYDEEKLPELTSLIAPNRSESKHALFRDQHGHGGDLAVDAGVLLWLRVLYGTDLNSYKISAQTAYDVKALAQTIVDNDRYAAYPAK